MNMEAAKILEKIKELDRTDWSYPSTRTQVEVHKLEQEYTKLTGKPCPAWPRREVVD